MVILISFIREISHSSNSSNNNSNNTLGVPVKNYELQSRWSATSGANPLSKCAKQSIDFKKQQRGEGGGGTDRQEGSFGHSSHLAG
jgi:hypothetical protein